MGKNQAYKAMQRSRLGSSSGAPEEDEDGMVDSSFHSPEWHAARLASLKTSHTITWEEYKKKQKEEELRKGEVEADKDRMMVEYRAQLDAERACKLARGSNHSISKSSHKRVINWVNEDFSSFMKSMMSVLADKKEKDLRKHSSKKRKHSRISSHSSSSSSSETSSTDDDKREAKRSKSRLKRRKKEKRQRSRSKQSNYGGEEADGPLPLSRFYGGHKG